MRETALILLALFIAVSSGVFTGTVAMGEQRLAGPIKQWLLIFSHIVSLFVIVFLGALTSDSDALRAALPLMLTYVCTFVITLAGTVITILELCRRSERVRHLYPQSRRLRFGIRTLVAITVLIALTTALFVRFYQFPQFNESRYLIVQHPSEQSISAVTTALRSSALVEQAVQDVLGHADRPLATRLARRLELDVGQRLVTVKLRGQRRRDQQAVWGELLDKIVDTAAANLDGVTVHTPE